MCIDYAKWNESEDDPEKLNDWEPGEDYMEDFQAMDYCAMLLEREASTHTGMVGRANPIAASMNGISIV